MNLTSVLAWLRQPTTIAGISGLIGTLVAVLLKEMTIVAAIPLISGAIVAMLLPDNTSAKSAVMQLTEDMIVAKTAPGGAAQIVKDAAALGAAFGNSNVGTVALKSVASMALFGLALSVGACSQDKVQAALQSPAGQLFCAIDQGGGSQITVGLIDAEASAALPAASPAIVLATGAAASTVQSECQQAAANIGAKSGAPVSPPTLVTGSVQNVAIKVAGAS